MKYSDLYKAYSDYVVVDYSYDWLGPIDIETTGSLPGTDNKYDVNTWEIRFFLSPNYNEPSSGTISIYMNDIMEYESDITVSVGSQPQLIKINSTEYIILDYHGYWQKDPVNHDYINIDLARIGN